MTVRINGNEDRVLLLRELHRSRECRQLKGLGRGLAAAGLVATLVLLVAGWASAPPADQTRDAGLAQEFNGSPQRPELAGLVGERGS